MRRSLFLAGVGAAAAFGGGAQRVLAAGGDDPMHLIPVRVSADRLIRTTVCLRPFRPAGFALRRETYGSKPVVHDYGHGGGGVSLSWGAAMLAADLAQDVPERRAAVVGAGAVGLATARVLQDRGFRVAIYAAQPPLETTSSRAGAQWSPVTTVSSSQRTAAYTALLARASTLAYRAFQDLVGDEYGVRWIENYAIDDDPNESPIAHFREIGLETLYPDVRVFGPGQHPFPGKYATRFATMLIQPPVYLSAVFRDFLLRGGTFAVRTFQHVEQLQALDEPIVFNCTGLGARDLFGDRTLVPLKGQLSFMLPQPDVDYITLGPGDAYMFPRADGIALGGTHERDVWSLDPNEEAQTRVIDEHARFFASMRASLEATGAPAKGSS